MPRPTTALMSRSRFLVTGRRIWCSWRRSQRCRWGIPREMLERAVAHGLRGVAWVQWSRAFVMSCPAQRRDPAFVAQWQRRGRSTSFGPAGVVKMAEMLVSQTVCGGSNPPGGAENTPGQSPKRLRVGRGVAHLRVSRSRPIPLQQSGSGCVAPPSSSGTHPCPRSAATLGCAGAGFEWTRGMGPSERSDGRVGASACESSEGCECDGISSLRASRGSPRLAPNGTSGTVRGPERRGQWRRDGSGDPEQPPRVVAGDQPSLVVGHVLQRARSRPARLFGPHRVGVRVVGFEQDLVDSDLVPRRDAGLGRG